MDTMAPGGNEGQADAGRIKPEVPKPKEDTGASQRTNAEAPANSIGTRIGTYVLVSIPAAYAAGYLAWSIGTNAMGLGFLSPDPVRIAALGSLSLLLGSAFFFSAWVGREFAWQATTKNHRLVPLYGTLLALGLGAALSAAVMTAITSTVGIRPPHPTLPVIIMGGVFGPAIMWFAFWLARGSLSHRRWDDAMRPGVPLVASIVVSLWIGGLVLGLAVAPQIPGAAGGLAPAPAFMTAAAGYAFPAGLGNFSSSGDGEASQAVVWVFPAYGGDWLMRPGCADVRSAPVFVIPREAVASVQWITEETRSQSCAAIA